MGISAEVILHFPDHQVRWPADPIQLSSGLNPTTRTIGLILEVNKPWENIIPGEHPPLLSGMYLEVILRGRQTQNKIVIPRCALRGNEVLTLNKESRLERQTITIQLLQEDIAIVENLAHPTTIILNPPTFALPNTLVEGIINSQISEGCRKRALGIEAK
jgi:multidrug efflux pump subunit AcrA (membrane-fusion protein)